MPISKIRPISGRTLIYLFLLKKPGHVAEILAWCRKVTGGFIKFENSTVFRELRDMTKEKQVIIEGKELTKSGQEVSVYNLTDTGIAMGLYYQESIKGLINNAPAGYTKTKKDLSDHSQTQ